MTTTNTVRIVVNTLALILLILFFQSAEASTRVETDISVDTTWTVADSPYIIPGELEVATGATLTIDAGVVVKLHDYGGLNVLGTLNINGEQGNEVNFTSVRDDSLGGNTWVPNATNTPMPGDWRGVKFQTGSSGTLRNVVFKYAGFHYNTREIPTLLNEGGVVTLDNSAFSLGGIYAIGQTEGSLTLINSVLDGFDYSLVITGGDAYVENNEITNARVIGVYNDSPESFTLKNNRILNTSSAVELSVKETRSLELSGNQAENSYYNGIILRGPVKGEFNLVADSIPYIISNGGLFYNALVPIITENDLLIESTGSLNFKNGSVIKFNSPHAKIVVNGTLTTEGTEESPVYFTSLYDKAPDQIGTKFSDREPAKADWNSIAFKTGSVGDFIYTNFSYGGDGPGALINDGGTINVEGGKFSDNQSSAVRHTDGITSVQSSSFKSNSFGIVNETALDIDATNNYWGDPSGPYQANTNSDGLGDPVSDHVLYEPWADCFEDCSKTPNVLFLPGIMGTRLSVSGEQAWEPESEGDIDKLYLDDSGSSINSVSVDQVIETFDGPLLFNFDLYKDFIAELETIKNEGKINDFVAYPYDWRLSYSDILSDKSLENTLRDLASNSQNGKVTIVAHSNGGLLTKALINSLGDDAANLIDKIVFVGVPQLGTPQAVGALMHGFDSGIQLRYSDAKARNFALNAPMSYQLLPQPDYYDNSGVSVYSPLVTFGDGSATQIYKDSYGDSVDGSEELRDYLVGGEGRPKPDYDDTASPAIANSALYAAIGSELSSIGSQWQVPDGIEVHQIAGVGELTPSSINYQTIKKCVDRILWYCTEYEDALSYDVTEVVDGDGTVVEPSALLMSDSNPNVHRWWIDLDKYHNDHRVEVGIFRKNHKNLLEINEVGDFVKGLLFGEEVTNINYISSLKPNIEQVESIKFVLHSPLNMSLLESDGSTVNIDNPSGENGTYERYGEIQVVNYFGTTPPVIELEGVNSGSFTLDVIKQVGRTQIDRLTFEAIPVSTSSKVFFNTGSFNMNEMNNLEVDYDGDGKSEYDLEASSNTIVHIELNPGFLISDLKSKINYSIDNSKLRKELLSEVSSFENKYKKYNQRLSKINKLIFLHPADLLPKPSIYLIGLETKVKVSNKVGKISDVDTDELLQLISLIKQSL